MTATGNTSSTNSSSHASGSGGAGRPGFQSVSPQIQAALLGTIGRPFA